MIKCDKGRTEIDGESSVVEAEIICILNCFREVCEEKWGKEYAGKTLNRLFEDSKLSDEEMEQKYSAEAEEKALDKLLDKIMEV